MKLDNIQKLCDEATTGPWYAIRDCVATNPNSTPSYPPDMAVIASLYDGEYIENPNARRDAEFTAAARELVPKLLAVAVAAKGLQEDYLWRHEGGQDDRQYLVEALDKALRELEE